MPLARKPADYRTAIGEFVYAAMIGVLNVPKNDRFQVISEHSSTDLVIDPSYLGIQWTKDAMVIEVTLNQRRTVEMKRAFYKAVADGLHERVGLRRDDVTILHKALIAKPDAAAIY
jgi:4-oxalocrotonate tautomerase